MALIFFHFILPSLALILPMCFYFLAHWKVYPQQLPGIPYNQTASHHILGDIPDLVTSVRLTKERREEGVRRVMRELDRFEPERWLVRKNVKRGRRLAMQELRMMIVLLTLSFKFLPLPESLNGMEGRQMVLRSRQQCYVKVEVI
ncbi:uncharacterized protein B0T23DRAFT_421819 [Neurospora hispaniola]|uniref:Uncharacterized protein n=1 Tax=Neurospora hispaniola TaxID=588809 RepID=A0AAJ0I3E2_9PEZI|nr:hypothetical protein B0T23DRAFT_421819 [Neurospora hispaniola]